jgi:membrane protein implicated in regulation of membrane protease activity
MARVDWRRVKPILMQALGYAFLVVGVLGLVLPFLQGILFLLIGLIILAEHAPWARRLLERVRERYPKAGELIDTAEAKAGDWWRWIASFGRR